MKITKEKLKQLIKEEVQKSLNETKRLSDTEVGDFLEIEISSDGYDTSVLPIDPNEYENKMSMGMGQKMLVKVVQVAEDYAEDKPKFSPEEIAAAKERAAKFGL